MTYSNKFGGILLENTFDLICISVNPNFTLTDSKVSLRAQASRKHIFANPKFNPKAQCFRTGKMTSFFEKCADTTLALKQKL